MAKKKYAFKYVGDPNDAFSGPPVAEHFGYEFPKGEAVDVELDDENEEDRATLQKLAGHSHFVDMSDKKADAHAAQVQKDMEAAAKAREKREEDQRKQDEKDAEQMEKNRLKDEERGGLRADTAPRPPGKVTMSPPTDPFQGRTVEQRTRAEDHTKAGKTKS